MCFFLWIINNGSLDLFFYLEHEGEASAVLLGFVYNELLGIAEALGLMAF